MLSKETKAGSGTLYVIRVLRSTLKTLRKTPETKARKTLETLVVSADVVQRNSGGGRGHFRDWGTWDTPKRQRLAVAKILEF